MTFFISNQSCTKKSIIVVSSILLMLWSFVVNAEKEQGQVGYQLSLNLQEAITLALAKDYGIQVAKFNPDIAQYRVDEQTGAFEPVVGMRYRYQQTDQFSNDYQSVDDQNKVDTAAIFLRGDTPWGTTYKLEVNGNTSDSNSIHSGLARNVIEITQPLLKGFGYNDNYAAVRLAENNHQVAQFNFSQTVMRTVRAVVNAYTDLYAAQESLKVAIQSRDLAGRLVSDNQKRVAIGKISESSVLQAQARFASRQQRVISAERLVQINMNRLKLFIADQSDDFLALNLSIKPLPQAKLFTPEIVEDYQLALKARPDYQRAKLEINSQEVIVKREQRRNLPQVDLSLGYEQIGRSNQASFSSAFDNQIADSAYVGLSFSMPLTNRSAKAREKSAELSLQQQQIEMKRFERDILAELDNAIITAKADWQRIEAANEALNLAQKTLTAEEKKHKVGRSQAFFLLDIQRQLAEAELSKVRAVSDYYKSYVNYEFSKGNILNFYGIKT